MNDAGHATIYLKDYTPFGWTIAHTDLHFTLAPEKTRVHTRVRFHPNPDAPKQAFFLHGENLDLKEAHIDGKPVDVIKRPGGIEVDVPDGPFDWESVVEINPASNTALEGLYISNGMYCTQCEAEGFRKITYYPDRPDVLAVFRVTIEAGEPVLLSNGNPVSRAKGRAEWHDPWPKPAYLFALVAGDLVNHAGTFTTASGRNVETNIWVRPGDENKCAFAMESLIKSMRWDEDVYAREYDLDVFNIVAVDDFNMGAMENKGLNIFNAAAVLANPETTTDAGFERIEGIIAHEYFHNWTGNRITCRDWFQLCLKEGLTVFRDAQFTADMRSAAVKRIGDVTALRARQFREDNGPLAHPVRPEKFVEINNFYTATVYEKGAEVIGMLKLLVGNENWARALALYFARHDGQAATIEDWLAVFQDVTGRDLTQFKRWYTQAGTPRLDVRESYENGRFTLTFRQSTPPTPDQQDKAPFVIPVAVGLLDHDGHEIRPTTILEITEQEQSFHFDDVPAAPVASILRGFSAPVIFRSERPAQHLLLMLAHDTDPFNRWQAGRDLIVGDLIRMATEASAPDPDTLGAMTHAIADESMDPAFRAKLLALPGEDEIAQAIHDAGHTPDPEAIWKTFNTMRETRAQFMENMAHTLYSRHQIDTPFQSDAAQAGARALANAALAIISKRDAGETALAQFRRADNMTDYLAAFVNLLHTEHHDTAVRAFEKKWGRDRMVMNTWFGSQVLHASPQTAATTVHKLLEHTEFSMHNPNRVRALFGTFAANHAGFHAASGAGYRLMADALMRLDKINPQTTARLSTAFETWPRYDAARQAHITTELDRILAVKDLSRDTREMVQRLRSA